MGMYTELYLGVELKKDTPEEIVNYLKAESDGVEVPYVKGMPRRLKLGLRWGSYYFDAQPTSMFRYDEISRDYYFTMIANIKNYEQEWQWLLNWLESWIASTGHCGHIRYEEDHLPTLIMYDSGKFKMIKLKEEQWQQK